MKKRYLVFGVMVAALSSKAQVQDSSFQKKKLAKSDIEVAFSYYHQNGNHSAITGGIGTEKLNVYAPDIKYSHTYKSADVLNINGGADVITSASLNNIDFVVSSASKHDVRTHVNTSYSKHFDKLNTDVELGSGFSIESVYFSIPVSLSLNYTEPSQMRTYQFAFEAFFDDLRWGRLSPDHFHPVELIYPVELRNKNWFNIYRRYSYNFKNAFTQVINKRMILGLYPEIAYQQGLLSTTYHRVFFTDSSEKVENLPQQRLKLSLGAQLNMFIGGRTILKTYYSIYRDNWGIVGNALQIESAFKINSRFTISPFIRFYEQTKAEYFKPYRQHDLNENFYTSDYDLSKFTDYKAGINLRLAPFSYLKKKLMFDEMNLRYSFYRRSDGLTCHMISTVFNFTTANNRSEKDIHKPE
ncbi:MAG TPA: DUF3570 domain-containing protein [Puia sp.]|nr:DUF3570 domain-containing protein [Puia sp.]